MSTLNNNLCAENRKDFPKLSLFASWTGATITLSGSNYPCLERISMVPKMFEPLGLDCIKGYFSKIFLFYHENVCCVYSLESPHRGDSNEYTQRTSIW